MESNLLNSVKIQVGDLEVKLASTVKISGHTQVSAWLYLYDQGLSSQDIQVLPYESYAEEIKDGDRSLYAPRHSSAANWFGLVLGLCVALIFLLTNPQAFTSLEALVALFGTYAIGKEIWKDLDNLLGEASVNWKVRWVNSYFQYRRERLGTIEQILNFARSRRKESKVALADNFGLNTQSNSQIAHMDYYYGIPTEAELLSFKLQKPANSWLVGLKLTQIKSLWFLKYTDEKFQCLQQGQVGIVINNNFLPGQYLHRRTVSITDKLKIYLKDKVSSSS